MKDFREFSYDIYQEYKKYCDRKNLEEHGQRALVEELKNINCVRKYKPMKDGKRRRGFKSLKLKDN